MGLYSARSAGRAYLTAVLLLAECYLIDDNSALLVDQDSGLVLRGALARQF
jgi:hypothetical protein